MPRTHSTGALITLALTAVLAPACKGPAGADGTNGTNGFDALVSTTALSAGDSHCPNGGTEIDSGLDDGSGGGTANDGVLQSGEITSTSYVCNPAIALVKATRVPYGDANCPGGGTRIDTGLDDGSGGGTANDGILQPGEITSTTYDCNDGTQSHVGSFEPPPGAEVTHFIDTSGGSSTADGSTGGDGGYLETYMAHGSAGGHLGVFKTGQVDASFTFPAKPGAFDYGSQELEIASERHVQPVNALSDGTDLNGNTLVDGDLVIVECDADSPVYVWHSGSTDTITGVHIASGGTLIFDPRGNSCPQGTVVVGHAFVNEGTLATAHDAGGTADGLSLWVGSYYGASGSKIDLRGATKTAAAPGGDGGDLDLEAIQSSDYWGALWNQGTIDTSGGDGDDGGHAGVLYLWANSNLYNTGALVARGGDAVTLDYSSKHTTGGDGQEIVLESFGGVYNSGAVDASGGKGSMQGGAAKQVTLWGGENNSAGDLYNSGDLAATGGDADASCTDTGCGGGDGATIQLDADGNILSSGNLSTYGGNGQGGTGGNGGSITSHATSGAVYSTVHQTTVPGGALWVSGDVDTHGGDGAQQGGNGGYISANVDPGDVPVGQEIRFLGYGSGIDTRGGDATAQGGNAGYTKLYQSLCTTNAGACAWPAGSIINYVDIDSRGGDASAGDGGEGGYADWHTVDSNYAVGSFGYEKLINHGSVDTSGGQGSVGGGISGYIWFYGLDGVDNEGLLTANGGAATDADGSGGDATSFSQSGDSYGISLLASRGSVANTVDLSAAGGASTATSGAGMGGSGAGVHLEGPIVHNSGYLIGDGGDSNTTSGTGGDAANVVLQSFQGSTDNSGPLLAFGGVGAPGQAGMDAYVVIDGQIGQ